ncbi:MAG: RNA-binding S4 domain-containing protein [Actinomycetaceae bacterium]|nr:RNA-binding S4 domain-containing protein [Actinomycetaceae bacterium]
MENLGVRLPIRLGQFIKLAGLAETGSHARELIEFGEVSVNNERETRRGRQLADGDIVSLESTEGTIRIRVTSDDD